MAELWITGFAALTALLLAMAGISVGYHLHQVNRRLQYEISANRTRLGQLENDLGALCTASAGEGQHVVRLEPQSEASN